MSNKSSSMKRKGGNVITKKMITERMENMATLMTAMETTLLEWEIWFRLIKSQKKFLTTEQWEAFITDGPIFSDITGKIMESVRQNVPKLEKDEDADVPPKPGILGADGNVANSTPENKIIV
jgi:hypothetical protein